MASPPTKTYKEQLYAWLGRRSSLIPVYKTYPDGAGYFICSLSAHGYNLQTEGRAVKKADACEDAAQKFVKSLQKEGRWSEADTSSSPRSAPPPPRSDVTHRDETNPKTALNLYIQQIKGAAKYDTTGPNTDGRFECRLNIRLPSGQQMEQITCVGLSKVEATRACAEQALAKLRATEVNYVPVCTAAPPAEADGPRLGSTASLPTPASGTASKRQWNKARPNFANPKSLLNEFLQHNGVGALNYVTQQQPDGKFHTSCRVELMEGRVSLCPDATGSSKTESTKKCAEEVIRSLEKLELIEPDGSAVSDAPGAGTPSVHQVLQNWQPFPPGPVSPVVPPPGSVLAAPPQAPLHYQYPPVTPPAGTSVIYYGPVNHYVNHYGSGATGGMAASDACAMPQTTPPLTRHESQPSRPMPVPDHLKALFESSEVVTERHILKASRKIGELRKTIGLSLGLDPSDVQNCHFREEDPYEVNRCILRVWREKVASGATVGRLCTVLWECEAYEAVRDLATVA